MTTDRRVLTAGWSRTRIDLREDEIVLDVGCGAFPNARADIACDRSLEADRHRTGRSTTVDRPFVIADAAHLPFKDKAVDFVLASHVAEHVESPQEFCSELQRVGRSGYLETPSPLADFLLDEDYHVWRVSGGRGRVRFRTKPERSRLGRSLTDGFYAVFYAGRPSGEKPTLGLPAGTVGRILGRALWIVRGSLNRSGLMHTRVTFDEQGLDVDVVQHASPSVLLVGRRFESGFMRMEVSLLRSIALVRTADFQGYRPAALLQLWQDVGSVSTVISFFGAKHALFPALFARLRRRRFVVVTGGYDVAAVRSRGYGLGAGWQRVVPMLVMTLSDSVLPFSEAAAAETLAVAPWVRKRMSMVHLAVDPSTSPSPSEQDRSSIVTVAYVDAVSYWRKGIDRFIALARARPELEFELVGEIDPAAQVLLEPVPANLKVHGRVDDEVLGRVLAGAAAYVQLSEHEGFGMAMAEAMVAGAVPVISDQPALREVAAEWAVVSRSATDDSNALDQALARDVDRRRMRADVLARFSAARRRECLRSVVT